MNNDLEQFSEERLMQMERALSIGSLDDRPTMDEMLKITRIALAAKQAKPVAWKLTHVAGAVSIEFNKEVADLFGIFNGNVVEPFYTTPQPAHTEQDGWIKCSERMPADARDVTVLSKEHGVVNGYYWSGLHWGKDVDPSWFISCGNHEGKADDITHWMPLPAAPKPESE